MNNENREAMPACDGGPAFPVWELNGHGQPEMTGFGMTLRDYGAALVELHATDRMLTAWLGDFAMLPEGTEVRAECKRRRDAIRAAIARATGQETSND